MTRERKLKIGQVVQVHNPHGFGTVTAHLHGGEVEITFWDFDKGSTWSWMYPAKDLQPLNELQKGKR